ncbi:MAG: hypothetical protein ACFB6S_10890 [Geminicoccaceae bacterium]
MAEPSHQETLGVSGLIRGHDGEQRGLSRVSAALMVFGILLFVFSMTPWASDYGLWPLGGAIAGLAIAVAAAGPWREVLENRDRAEGLAYLERLATSSQSADEHDDSIGRIKLLIRRFYD